jgi:hypothetical protein
VNSSRHAETLSVRLSDSTLNGRKNQLAAEADHLKEQMLGHAYSVDDAVRPAPGGSRAIGIPDVGTFIVALEPARRVVTELVALADSWLKGRPTRKVEFEVNGKTILIEGTAARSVDSVVNDIMEALDRKAKTNDSGAA